MSFRRQISVLVLLASLPLSARSAPSPVPDSGPARESADRPEPEPGAAPAQLLTSTREIRQLSPQEAQCALPVKLRATVTGFLSDYGFGYHVMDETGPIYVFSARQAAEEAPRLKLGAVMEIEGVSDAGRYAPCVREIRRSLVGEAALPPPQWLAYEQLASGAEDCQYAEIEGIVRSASGNGLLLAMGEGRVEVDVSAHAASELGDLVDAKVRLRGVVSGRFNQKRQWVGARFTVSSPDGIVVTKPAPADPFAASAHSVRNLLQWEVNQGGRHRVKVRGVVTHFEPGGALFIREGSIGLQIRTSETENLTPGDVVEVLGFPAHGTYSALLEDAVFRRLGHQVAPLPFPAVPDQLLRGEADASLVSVRGLLLESVRQQGARVLVMQASDVIFHAQLLVEGQEAPELPIAGSLLQLTGICVVAETMIDGARLSPRTFSLLLRSPTDIRVVQRPAWWTARRLWQALGVISLTAVGILSWVCLLRRQVRAQTAALKDQAQREAILEERTRIARELHDTLDQELTGISLQLNAVASQVKDDPVSGRLEVVHRLLKRSQSEVRRSVWDLRHPALESGSLASALDSTAAQLRNGSTATLKVAIHGAARPLLALVEHHLLRIAAEAVTNAFKHACAARIGIDLFYEPGMMRLCVTDDGRGFVAEEAPGYAAGHFGLIGMRERSRKIGATFNLETAPGKGTRIEIRLQEGSPGKTQGAGRSSAEKSESTGRNEYP